jgi:hypothetical protein
MRQRLKVSRSRAAPGRMPYPRAPLLPGLLLCALLLLLLTLGFPNLLLADETRRQQLIAQRHAHEMECSSEIYGCVV